MLHLMLVLPDRKDVIKRRWTRELPYSPVVFVMVAGIPVLLSGPSRVALAMLNGIVLLLYASLSAAALIHSYVKADPADRRDQGLNVLLAGLIVGLLPVSATVVAGLFGVRADLLPGADYVALTLVGIPIAIALALVRCARRAQPSCA